MDIAIKKQIDGALAELEALSDEIRVKLHLAGREAIDFWNEKLEPRLFEARQHAEEIKSASQFAIQDTLDAFKSFHVRTQSPEKGADDAKEAKEDRGVKDDPRAKAARREVREPGAPEPRRDVKSSAAVKSGAARRAPREDDDDEAALRAKREPPDSGDAFLPDVVREGGGLTVDENGAPRHRVVDEETEAFASEFLTSATSAEDAFEDARDEVVPEESGGPFITDETPHVPEPPAQSKGTTKGHTSGGTQKKHRGNGRAHGAHRGG